MKTEEEISKELEIKQVIHSFGFQIPISEIKNIEIELKKRVPIWNSISEFYLDTELEEANYKIIVNTFLNSGLSISELKDIDLYEVFPLLKSNLINIAGVWNGFNEKWLVENCTRLYFEKNNKFFKWKIKFYNLLLYFFRKHHWVEIENRIKNK